ncbi:hypothetical protein PMI16_05030 [Herbaspirillum sp. CF444]|uniref:hypothetical protein n=1 Tax=Herbaspirillum sp. CF444 TaxID=1144319 RepID=UPI00027263E8|nr:hypothetical protein [Herbaspirillum sp. CF444]EJL80715.1 hypothetical protein PMI16_05030 [Herbaspirillum sp. CF444]
MPIEQVGDYEIEYSGVKLVSDRNNWAATVAIFGPSTNPMHRNAIFPSQRVLLDTIFEDEKSAEREARKAAVEMLPHH